MKEGAKSGKAKYEDLSPKILAFPSFPWDLLKTNELAISKP